VRFAKHWWIVGILGLLVIPNALGIIVLLAPLVRASSLRAVVTEIDMWLRLAVAIMIVALGAKLTWIVMTQMMLTFTEHGIATLSARGRSAYDWDEILNVELRLPIVRLITARGSVDVNLYFYQHPDDVLRLIRTKTTHLSDDGQ
jgi:hypothetical protein